MGIVCFRFRSNGLNAEEEDALNQSIVENVNRGGRAYLTHTRLGDRIVMRVGLGNILTTEVHLASAWALIRAESQRLRSAAR
jgi:glutamate/tyrosine decarboxylase-like PLP-dependent enzyme